MYDKSCVDTMEPSKLIETEDQVRLAVVRPPTAPIALPPPAITASMPATLSPELEKTGRARPFCWQCRVIGCVRIARDFDCGTNSWLHQNALVECEFPAGRIKKGNGMYLQLKSVTSSAFGAGHLHYLHFLNLASSGRESFFEEMSIAAADW